MSESGPLVLDLVCELLILGNHCVLVPRGIVEQAIDHFRSHDRQSDRKDKLVAVELRLALVFVHWVRQELAQVEVWTLNDNLLLAFDIELNIFELCIGQPHFDKKCVTVSR